MYYHQQWSESDTVKLIKLYEKAECLWNPSNESYKNFDHKDLEIDSMVQAMEMPGLDENELKCKIKMIRSIYVLELHKIEARSRHHKEPKNVTSNVKWFPIIDKFLRDVIYSDVIWEGGGIPAVWTRGPSPETNIHLFKALENCFDDMKRPERISCDDVDVVDKNPEDYAKDWLFKLSLMSEQQRNYAILMINGILRRGMFELLRFDEIDEDDRIFHRDETEPMHCLFTDRLVYKALHY
ncbi:PREDICTED: uncharacterized protein LOC108563048 [Nicrophorus vespilloides]|uniref:Uncharacterized protein LOC108563048 n=1 Tax=Nicrophorus vespilloides TaxID=110193 RepID=A0ABM1MR91_NICVS|nr:PREDICTED: uncharacterized protein LOC108563048 [Nicrophorus vespilloides]